MSTQRRIWGLAWRLIVCAILLIWIFHSIFLHEAQSVGREQGRPWGELSTSQQWELAWTHGPPALWETLQMVHPAAFAFSLFFMGCTLFLGAIRWRYALQAQSIRLPFARTVEISLVAHFFNSFLLGSTGGDLLKAYYAARETHHLKTEAVVTVMIDRLIGLFTMLAFGLVMLIPHFPLLMQYERMLSVAAFVMLMFTGILALVTLAFWGGLSGLFPKIRPWLRKLPKGTLIEKCVDSCRTFGSQPRFLFKALTLSVGLNLACVLQFYSLSRGLGLEIGPLLLLAIVPIIISIAAVPITPSGLGVRENLFVWLLSVPAIGVESTKALSLSLLAFGGSLFWSIIGGAVYLTFRERHHLAEVASEEPSENLPSHPSI